MSTSANIGIIYSNGKINGIHVNWDGYPEYVGKVLLEHYNDHAKVCDLIDLGDISFLGKHLNPTSEEHSFDHPERDVTLAYHRDRGEHLHISRYDDLNEFSDDHFHNYLYNVDTDEWMYSEGNGSSFQELWTIVNV